METAFPTALESYVRAKHLAKGTQDEYFSTLKKWEQWGAGAPLEQLNRRHIREFLDWVYQRAIAEKANDPGHTTNKAKEHLRAVISWAWEQDLIESTPTFPKPKPQHERCGATLFDEGGNQCIVFRYPQNEATAWLEWPFSDKSILAKCSGCLL